MIFCILTDKSRKVNKMLHNIFDDVIDAMSISKSYYNLYTVKSEDGKITEWKIELVYTPFKKEDISVNVSGGLLSVEIGTENKTKDKDFVYQGISNQYTKFSFSLSDKIDTDNITAKANDGILTITMPVKEIVPKPTRKIELQ